MPPNTVPPPPKPQGQSVGAQLASLFGWLIFIPLSIGICYLFKGNYDKFFPPQKKPELIEVPEIEVTGVPTKEVKVKELSPGEKGKIAYDSGYLHVAANLFKMAKVEEDNFNRRLELTDRIDMIEQTIADQKNYLAAVQLYDAKRYYAARACLDDILNVGDKEAEIEALDKKVDLALSVDDAMIEYINGNLEKVMDLLSENDSEEALKLLRKATEVADLVEMAKGKMDRMEFDAAKFAYEEVITTIGDDFHPISQDASTQLQKLSDRSKLADLLIERGDKLLNERKFKEVKPFYIKASEFDTEKGNKKIEYFDGLPKLLYKRAGENQKTRPMMAYYALKDAMEMVEDGSSLHRQIKSKMVSIAGMLKRYKVEVE